MSGLWKLVVNYQSYLVTGVKITIIVSVMAIIIGFLLGAICSVIRIGKCKILKWIVSLYVEFIRGTPVLVQISMVYYGLPLLGFALPDMKIMGVQFNRLISGVLALGLNSAAYVCEIIRGGILSVDVGQTEAAVSLGFTNRDTIMRIILPQALKNALPSLANEFIVMIKTSSQVSVIGLADLMFVADVIRGNSFRPFAPLVIVAVIYLIITECVSYIFRRIERNIRKN